MASPQVENGFIKIAIELIEAFARTRLSGREWQVLMALLRKTWGWEKKEDAISLSQFSKMTGISSCHCADILTSLEEKKVIKKLDITYPKNGTRNIRKYKFNKNYNEWCPSPKKRTSPENRTDTSPENGNSPVPKTGHTINNSTINNSQYIYNTPLVPKKGNDKKLKDKDEFSDEFLKFWNIYPRKIEKQGAWKAWNVRIKEKIPPEDMITAAENYAEVCRLQQTEEKFIKHPKTFLGPSRPFEDFIKMPKIQPLKIKPSQIGYAEPGKFPGGGKGGILSREEIRKRMKGDIS